MSQNKVTMPCLRKQELARTKQRSLNPKANPDVVAEKKKRLKHCWQTTARKSKQDS